MKFLGENFSRFPHGILKKGQFFILAAVIIAAVIISLGMTTNYVRVNREPENFYDFSYEVRKESGVVLDHQIYSDFDDDVNLTDFVDLLAEDIRNKDPDANFIFIYGSNDGMVVRNYGEEDVDAGGETVPGGGEIGGSQIGTVSSGGDYIGTVVDEEHKLFKDDWVKEIGKEKLEDTDKLKVKIKGNDYDFAVSEHKQVIFIMQKDVEDETFIAVE